MANCGECHQDSPQTRTPTESTTDFYIDKEEYQGMDKSPMSISSGQQNQYSAEERDLYKVKDDLELENEYTPDQFLLEGLRRIEEDYFGRIKTAKLLEAAHMKAIKQHFKSERLSAHRQYQVEKEQLFEHFRNTIENDVKCEGCQFPSTHKNEIVPPNYNQQPKTKKRKPKHRTVSPILLVRIKSEDEAGTSSNPDNGDLLNQSPSGQSIWCVRPKPKVHEGPCIIYSLKDDEISEDLSIINNLPTENYIT